jgi:hypothetical protein
LIYHLECKGWQAGNSAVTAMGRAWRWLWSGGF